MNKKTVPTYSWLYYALAAFAFLLYVNSIGYEYTMDDDIFFLKHTSVRKGFSGMGEIWSHGSMEKFDNTQGVQAYRPILLVVFAVEKELFGFNSAVSHFINVALYVLIALALFRVLRLLLRDVHPYVIALVTACFIAHPLHTEVVASVKSRDELLAGLFGLLAWLRLLAYYDSRKRNDLVFGILYFFIASFSKESSIAWIAVFPLSLIMFRQASIRTALLTSIPFATVSALYMAVRLSLVGTETDYFGIPVLANILTGTQTTSELLATKLELLWVYFRLLVVPWPLSWDYSFNQIPVVDFTSPLPWLALVTHAALLIFVFFRFRREPVFSFAILFFLVMMSPVNNFFINNTTTLGERLMFVPSLGICIALVFLFRKFLDSTSEKFSSIPGRKFINGSLLLIALFSGLTLVRSADWKNNMTLFQSGVDVCPNSSRTQYSLASECFTQMNKANNPTLRQEMAKKAGEHFQKSLEIMPENFQALYNYGLYNSAIGDTAKAIECYERVILLDSTYFTAMNNLGVIYGARLDFKNAFRCYRMAYALNPSSITAGNLANLYFNQGIYFGLNNLPDSSMVSYRNSVAYDPKYIMAYNNMAVIFANRMQYDSCIYYLKKGYEVDNANLMILENIGAMSYLNKQYDQAIDFAGKALSLNPQLPKSRNTLVNAYTAKGDKAAADKYR